MKLKDIKGLLPEEMETKKLTEKSPILKTMCDNLFADIHNTPIRQLGEKEIEIDEEKVIEVFNRYPGAIHGMGDYRGFASSERG